MTEKKKPTVSILEDGPYLVKGLEHLRSADGALQAQETMALCRCGGSKNKPFCDGTHAKLGFSGKNTADSSKDKRESYEGTAITVHDNRSICAHAGYCTEGLPSVFRMKERPWIAPVSASADEVIATVGQCPSGALSFSVDGVEHRDQEQEPSIMVAKNGPYVVSGGPELIDVPRAEGASSNHYTLCRCGGSKNKPFCDGAHWSIKFDDTNNKEV
ncbi:MAG: CDGSH iron-sulfur domain-containing protein [Vicinamibacteria bacterium]